MAVASALQNLGVSKSGQIRVLANLPDGRSHSLGDLYRVLKASSSRSFECQLTHQGRAFLKSGNARDEAVLIAAVPVRNSSTRHAVLFQWENGKCRVTDPSRADSANARTGESGAVAFDLWDGVGILLFR